MVWSHFVAALFSGLFLANTIPHLVKGVCGDPFPTPFAKPPGKGLSSPVVNTLWALANLLAGCWLFHAGGIVAGGILPRSLFFIGFAAISLQMSSHFSHKDRE
ncbi:MAG TPA: hypothetical protein VGN16_15825 [Acidobacteriaceae bacterium]|jgi:hypothetical protein